MPTLEEYRKDADRLAHKRFIDTILDDVLPAVGEGLLDIPRGLAGTTGNKDALKGAPKKKELSPVMTLLEGMISDLAVDAATTGAAAVARGTNGASIPVMITANLLRRIPGAMPYRHVIKEAVSEIPAAANKGMIAYGNELGESGNSTEATKQGWFNGITEHISDTYFDRVKLGTNDKKMVKTLVDLTTQYAQGQFADRDRNSIGEVLTLLDDRYFGKKKQGVSDGKIYR